MLFNFQLVLSACIEIVTSVFGVVFTFSLILYGFQKLNKSLLVQHFGFKSLYPTAIVGTPIHELGHTLLAVLFRHSIKQVKLFSPNSKTGVLGYVEHSYSSTVYQICGCFFIGIAPLIFGVVIIYLLNALFIPEVNTFFLDVDDRFIKGGFTSLFTSFVFFESVSLESLKGIGVALQAGSVIDIIWLYLIIAVSLHMGPSTADLKNALPGVIALAVLIIIGVVIFQGEIENYLPIVREWMQVVTKILMIACYANLLFFVLLLLSVGITKLIKR